MKLRGKIILTTLLGGLLILGSGLAVTVMIGMAELRSEIGENFKVLAKEAARKTDREVAGLILRLNDLIPLMMEEVREANLRYDMTRPTQDAGKEAAGTESARSAWEEERRGVAVVKPILTNRGSTLLRKPLENALARGEYVSLFVTDRRGALVATINGHPDYFHGDAEWWKKANDPEGDAVLIGNLHLSDKEERSTFDIVLPILDDETVEGIGVMKAVIDLKKLLEKPIHEIRFGKTGHADLVLSDGTVVISPTLPTGSPMADPSLLSGMAFLEPGWIQAEGDPMGKETALFGVAPVVEVNAILAEGGSAARWYVLVRQDPAETYRPIRSLLVLTSIAGLGLIGLTTAAATLLANHITRPIRLLHHGIQRIGAGNPGGRLEILSQDEVGELALEFNKMAGQIHESRALLEQKVADRTKDLALINQVAVVASRSLYLQIILKDALALVVDRMNADAGHIGVIDREGSPSTGNESFSAEEWLGAPENVIKHWQGQSDKTVHLDHPLLIDPDTAETDGMVLPFLHPPYKEIIAVPIEGGEGPLGILSLARWTSAPFSPQAVDLLVAVSRPISMAIQNAQLFHQVKKVDQLKSDLISNVSHEIRTPLTSILGYAELLQSGNVAYPSLQKFLSIITQEGKRLTLLLNDILDLSKLTSGKIEWDIMPTDLHWLLPYAINLQIPIAGQKGLTLRLEPFKNLPRVLGDEEHLLQVMSNLLSNAVKFTQSGEIVVGADREGDAVKVFVRDTGAGIQPTDREKIFEKFYQVSGDQEGKPKGTGLGLAICREIISHLGGRIWCESAPGRGTTFFFTLRIAEPPRPTQLG